MDSDSHRPHSVTPPPVIVRPPEEDAFEVTPLPNAKPGRLRQTLRFAFAHPWFSLVMGLVFALALAVICGLAPGMAQEWLILGLITMGLARFVVWRWRGGRKSKPAASLPPTPSPPKGFLGQFAEGFGTAVTFCAMAMFVYWHKPSHPKPVPPPGPVFKHSTPSIFRGNTQRYWQSTVAALHPHRFDSGSESNEGALPAWRRRLEQHRSVLTQVRAQQPTGVDQDLVAMAKRHFDFDQEYLQRQEKLLQATVSLAATPEELAALERLSFDALTERIHGALSNGQLPQEINEEWNAVAGDLEKYDLMFREITIMQARLVERYQAEGRRFLLPEIPDTASQSKVGNPFTPPP